MKITPFLGRRKSRGVNHQLGEERVRAGGGEQRQHSSEGLQWAGPQPALATSILLYTRCQYEKINLIELSQFYDLLYTNIKFIFSSPKIVMQSIFYICDIYSYYLLVSTGGIRFAPLKYGNWVLPHFGCKNVKLELKPYHHWKANILGFSMLVKF